MIGEKHHQWQRRLARRLPDAAARTFALRGKPYMGYGLHYALERQLGKVITIANDLDRRHLHGRDRIAEEIVDKIIVEGFFADLVKAEGSARP